MGLTTDVAANQTEDYALKEFGNKGVEDLDIKNHINYFYLTLDGSKPLSRAFQSITYGEEIRKSIPSRGTGKIYLLLDELRIRINEYRKWPAPRSNDRVINI
jgi:hypothetical protein